MASVSVLLNVFSCAQLCLYNPHILLPSSPMVLQLSFSLFLVIVEMNNSILNWHSTCDSNSVNSSFCKFSSEILFFFALFLFITGHQTKQARNRNFGIQQTLVMSGNTERKENCIVDLESQYVFVVHCTYIECVYLFIHFTAVHKQKNSLEVSFRIRWRMSHGTGNCLYLQCLVSVEHLDNVLVYSIQAISKVALGIDSYM